MRYTDPRTQSQVNSNTLALSYFPPVVLAAWPLRAPCVGGGTLNILGRNFGVSGPTVTIGGIVCAPLAPAVFNSTFVRCTVPAGSGRALPVVVTANFQACQRSNTMCMRPARSIKCCAELGVSGDGIVLI